MVPFKAQLPTPDISLPESAAFGVCAVQDSLSMKLEMTNTGCVLMGRYVVFWVCTHGQICWVLGVYSWADMLGSGCVLMGRYVGFWVCILMGRYVGFWVCMHICIWLVGVCMHVHMHVWLESIYIYVYQYVCLAGVCIYVHMLD